MKYSLGVNGPQLILAGPGTGKTTFLINRVIELIYNKSIKQKGIIVCTFTRKATEELKVRLYQEIPIAEFNKHNIIIGTIHSVCYELLSRYSEFDYGDYDILAEDNQVHFIYSKLKNLGYSSDKISKNGWTLAEELAAIFNKITDEEIDIDEIDFADNEDLEDACKVYKTYKRILKRFKLFDYATIQETLLRELERNSSLKEIILDNFKYYLIDEFQDVNNIQYNIFLKLSSPQYNLTVVGDDDQSIYGFRGSNIEHIRNFENYFLERKIKVEKMFLNINYRSSKTIINFTNKLLEKAKYNRVDKQIKAFRKGKSQKPIVRFFENEIQEVDAICNIIRDLKRKNIIYSYNQVALLFRSVKGHASVFIEEFKQRNIPFKLYGAGNMFNTVLGLEFMTLIDFYLARDIDKEIIFFDKIAQIDVDFNADLTSIYSENNYLDDLNEMFNNKKYYSCIDLIYDIFKNTGFLKRYEIYGNNIGKLTSIVLSFDDFSNYFDPWGLYSYLSYLKNSQNVDFDLLTDDSAVSIMTIHQSKGLEYPVVIMPSQIERSRRTSIVDKFNALRCCDINDHEEDFRVLYVGATRAEDLLILSGSKKLVKTNKTYKLNGYLRKVIDSEDVSNSLETLKSSDIDFRVNNIKNKENVVLSYNKVRLFEICPLAYMYANVWNLQTVRVGGLEFGRNTHKIIETIIRFIMKDKLLSHLDIEDIVEDNWRNTNFRSDNENEKFKNAAKKQIKQFTDNCAELLNKDKIFSVEDEFNVNVDGNLITGRFDAVFNNNNKYLIVDFKTGDKKDYSTQLSFYSLCFKKKYNVDSLKLAIYYLKDGVLEFIEPLDDKLVVQKISETANKIFRKEFTPKPSKYCKDCAFNNICEFYNKKN